MPSAFDLIRSTGVIFGIAFNARQDRKTWIFGDSVLWGCYGVGLFLFPGILFPGSSSALLSYIVRIFAALIIGMNSMWYLSRHTRDNNVIGATLWTRLISSLMLLLVLMYSYSQTPDKFPDKVLYFDILAYMMLLLSSVYQFWRGEYRVGGREQKGTMCTILRLIFLAFLLVGLVDLSYPTWVIPAKLDVMEIVMVRCAGAMFLGLSFTAMYAPTFKHEEDRISFLVSGIVSCVMIFISLNVAHFVDNQFTVHQALILQSCFVPVVPLVVYLLWKKNDHAGKSH